MSKLQRTRKSAIEETLFGNGQLIDMEKIEVIEKRFQELKIHLVLVYSFELRPHTSEKSDVLLDSAKAYYSIAQGGDENWQERSHHKRIIEAVLHPSFFLLLDTLFPEEQAGLAAPR